MVRTRDVATVRRDWYGHFKLVLHKIRHKISTRKWRVLAEAARVEEDLTLNRKGI